MSDEHQVTFIRQVKESFHNSFGEIVFGMSDGTVSIFGLVAGMVAGAQSGDVIVLAGATAAIAATVSMMAGVFLDLESEQDCTRVEAEERAQKITSDPNGAIEKLIGDLKTTGLSAASIDAIRADFQKTPLPSRNSRMRWLLKRYLRPRKLRSMSMPAGWVWQTLSRQ